MKQNTSLFFMAAILATFALFGVVYATPYFESSGVRIKADIIDARYTNDTGIELFYPVYSLIAFYGCAFLFVISKELRGLIFMLALANMAFVVLIPTIFKEYIHVPNYEMDNGYYLHALASLMLLILAISTLKKREIKKKPKDTGDLLDALD